MPNPPYSNARRPVDNNGNIIGTSANPTKTQTQPSTDLEGGGKISVGTTPVEVTFSGTPKSIIITADIANSGLLYIGKSDVLSDGSNSLTFLSANNSVTIDFDDSTNAIYVVASTAAQNFWKGAIL